MPDAAVADRRQLLLAAILADPDRDEARQVYADELIATGDPRGELIVIELALAGSLTIAKRERLAALRAALRAAHAATWWPYQLEASRSRGGFLEAVTGSLAQLTTAAPALFAAEPVTEVTLTGADADAVATLVAQPWLPRLRRLTVCGQIGDDGLAILAAAPSTTGLRALNLTATGVSGVGLGTLGGGLPACRSLCLTCNELGDDGVAALARWRHLERLETLYLTQCDVHADGIAALIDSGRLTALRKLALSQNPLGDDGAHAIASRAALMPALRHLELQRIELGAEGAAALLAAPLPALIRLDARRNYFAPAGLAADARLRV